MKHKIKPVKSTRLAPTPEPTPHNENEVEEFALGHKKLLRALDAAQQRATKAEEALGLARHNLGDVQSAALAADPSVDLNGSCSPKETSAFLAAHVHLDECRTGVEGCRRALARSDVNLLGAVEKLRLERQRFNSGAIAQFLSTVFEPAAMAFQAILRQGSALEAALGESISVLHQLPAHDDWREDNIATAIFEGNSQLKQLAESLDEYRLGAEQRLRIEERSKMSRAGFDPSTTAKYEVCRQFTCYGKEFVPGQKVNCYDIEIAVLSKLYGARNLRLVEPAQEGRSS